MQVELLRTYRGKNPGAVISVTEKEFQYLHENRAAKILPEIKEDKTVETRETKVQVQKQHRKRKQIN
jgi:hypothetical protein